MEQSVIDLKKIEEETKEKIEAVNFQKVTIVKAFMAQMKVWKMEVITEILYITTLHSIAKCQVRPLFFLSVHYV